MRSKQLLSGQERGTEASLERFEDIVAWRKARELVKEVYDLTSRDTFSRDYGLRDQIRRAALSVMSNIAEGFGRGGNKEFIRFLCIAKGSAHEVRSEFYAALDAGHIQSKEFDSLYQLCEETERLIAGFIRYLQQCPYRGEAFKGAKPRGIPEQRQEAKDGKPWTGNVALRTAN